MCSPPLLHPVTKSAWVATSPPPPRPRRRRRPSQWSDMAQNVVDIRNMTCSGTRISEKAPSLPGGTPYLLRSAPLLAKRMFFVSDERFCRLNVRHRRKGRLFVFEGRLHFREALRCIWRAPHLLRRAPSWAKRALFHARLEPLLVRGTQ